MMSVSINILSFVARSVRFAFDIRMPQHVDLGPCPAHHQYDAGLPSLLFVNELCFKDQ